MKKPVIAVYLIEVGLILIEESAANKATVQQWLKTLPSAPLVRYATSVAVEPEVNGHGLLVVAEYAAEQTGVSWPGPDAGQLQEVYRYRGAHLVLESNDFTED